MNKLLVSPNVGKEKRVMKVTVVSQQKFLPSLKASSRSKLSSDVDIREKVQNMVGETPSKRCVSPKVDPHERDQSRIVVLPDGRSLAFSQYGDLKSKKVILLIPPLEGIRIFGRYFDDAAQKEGCRLLCPDRPGFGFSSAMPDRHFIDFAKDLQFLLNILCIEKVVVIGHSAGAVYAAAFAVEYPYLVTAVALVAP